MTNENPREPLNRGAWDSKESRIYYFRRPSTKVGRRRIYESLR